FFPNRPQARKVAGRLRVLHEDPHVLIVDKPAGLLTQPTPDHERDTLVSRATRYLSIRHGGRTFLGVVHRLDKDTSGALALARWPRWSPAGWRRAGPTRSGSTWPRSAIRSSATRSIAPGTSPPARPSSTARRSTPKPWASSTRSSATR